MDLCKQNRALSIRITSLHVSQPSSVICECKTANLGPELQVSMCPSPYLWILHAKQRLLDQNYNSLLVSDLTCRFVHTNSVICTRITRLYGSLPSSVVFCTRNSDFITRITSLYGSQPSSVDVCTHSRLLSTRISSLYGFQPSHEVLCMQNSMISTRNTSLYGSQPSSAVLCTQNSVFITRITSLYGSQTSPVDLWLQNSVLTTRINSLYGSQTSSMDLWKQNRALSIRITSLYVSQPSSVICECKTANLGPELQVSMCPSPHLWILHAKQRLLDQNYNSLLVSDLTCRFVHTNCVICTRITRLYGSLPSSVVLCTRNSDFITRITSMYGSQPSSVVLCF